MHHMHLFCSIKLIIIGCPLSFFLFSPVVYSSGQRDDSRIAIQNQAGGGEVNKTEPKMRLGEVIEMLDVLNSG
jgi:hypothetical protein